MKSLRDLELHGRRLFLRVDFNVPLSEGRVTDRTRIEETLPTVRLAMEAGARVICASHLGKPKGKVRPELSLAPVAAAFAEALGRPVRFVEECVGAEVEKVAGKLLPGEVLLLENLRFHAGEESNDPEFARGLARLAEVYVDDAFGAPHRAHASVVGVPALLPEKAAGLLLEREIRGLSRLLDPERPFAAILGGAKISGKIDALQALARGAPTLCSWAAEWRTTSCARSGSRSAGRSSKKTRSPSPEKSWISARRKARRSRFRPTSWWPSPSTTPRVRARSGSRRFPMT